MKKIICEICNKAEHSTLCDHAVGSGIVSSIDFKEIPKSCDKFMCNECAVSLWANCDVCPEHAAEVQAKLLNGART